MMAGDAYSIPVRVTLNGEAVTRESFEDVEVCIGKVRKTVSDKSIDFDDERKLFLVPLSQEETFSLCGRSRINLRCKFFGGNVIGVDLGIIDFGSSISKEVL